MAKDNKVKHGRTGGVPFLSGLFNVPNGHKASRGKNTGYGNSRNEATKNLYEKERRKKR